MPSGPNRYSMIMDNSTKLVVDRQRDATVPIGFQCYEMWVDASGMPGQTYPIRIKKGVLVVMLWNFMMHVLMGWLGPNYFVFTPEGIGMAVLVVCVTQAVDQIRIRKEKWQEIDALPEKERKAAAQELEAGLNKTMALIYVQNVLIFTVVLLGAAQVARIHGWF